MAGIMWLAMIPIVAMLIVAIGLFALWRAAKEKRSGFPLKDERTLKLQGRSSTVAFYIGVWYLLGLNFYNMYRIELQGLEELGSMPVINSAVILMGVSYIVIYAFFNVREGGMEQA